jgi:hypothetical protein
MKNFVFVALAALAIYGCGETAATPEEVAKQFATSLDKGDFKAAKALGTQSTQSMLEMLEKFMSAGGEAVEKAKAEMGKAKFDEVKCEGTEDKKTCTVCCGANGQGDELELVKENGSWKVNINKDQGGSGSDAGEEAPVEAPAEGAAEGATEPAKAHDGGH